MLMCSVYNIARQGLEQLVVESRSLFVVNLRPEYLAASAALS